MIESAQPKWEEKLINWSKFSFPLTRHSLHHICLSTTTVASTHENWSRFKWNSMTWEETMEMHENLRSSKNKSLNASARQFSLSLQLCPRRLKQHFVGEDKLRNRKRGALWLGGETRSTLKVQQVHRRRDAWRRGSWRQLSLHKTPPHYCVFVYALSHIVHTATIENAYIFH